MSRPAIWTAQPPPRCLEALSTLVRAHGLTLMMVTHDPEAARHADRIVRLKDGHLVTEQRIAAMTFAYAWKLVLRNPRRTGTYLFGLALAVGLFAGILFFVDATARQMTATALAPVKLDLVAHATTPDVAMPAIVPTIAQARGITAAEPVTDRRFRVSDQGRRHAGIAGRPDVRDCPFLLRDL